MYDNNNMKDYLKTKLFLLAMLATFGLTGCVVYDDSAYYPQTRYRDPFHLDVYWSIPPYRQPYRAYPSINRGHYVPTYRPPVYSRPHSTPHTGKHPHR